METFLVFGGICLAAILCLFLRGVKDSRSDAASKYWSTFFPYLFVNIIVVGLFTARGEFSWRCIVASLVGLYIFYLASGPWVKRKAIP